MMSATSTFYELLRSRWIASNSLAAAGIDPDIALIPDEVKRQANNPKDDGELIAFFCQEIIKATAEYVCAYKVQPAFFSRHGEAGERALKQVIAFLHQYYADIPIIMDGKISDITNTTAQYVIKIYDELRADAVLVNPLMGSDTILPFVERSEKGVFVLCKTSNPSSEEILDAEMASGDALWRYLVKLSLGKWNHNKNIGLVLSANSPNDLVGIREIIGDTPILLAGVGAQGGNPETFISQVVDSNGYGFFVPSSRAIMFAQKYNESGDSNDTFTQAASRAARQLRDGINEALGK